MDHNIINYIYKLYKKNYHQVHTSYLNARHFSTEGDEVEIKQNNTENIVS